MDKATDIPQNHFLGSGWAFPVRFSALEVKTTAYENNINESVQLILATRRGERPLAPGFGSALHRLFFRTVDDTLIGEIVDAVSQTLLQNEPRITVTSVRVDALDAFAGELEVELTYIINQTNTRHNYVYPFHVLEGTNLPERTR